MEKIFNFLAENRTFFLATDEGGKPRVRPFGAVSIFGGKLYIVTNNQKRVYDQIMSNPNIEICACDPDGIWLRLTCKARLDGRRAAREKMLESAPELRLLYSSDDGLMEVFCLEECKAVLANFGGILYETEF